MRSRVERGTTVVLVIPADAGISDHAAARGQLGVLPATAPHVVIDATPHLEGVAMSRDAYVYLMSNVRNNVLYIGVTNDLVRRVAEHQLGLQPGFTQRYRCTKLVYFESGDSIVAAIQREKQLKNWRRQWKEELVASVNPSWADLGPSIGVTPQILVELATQRHRPG